jgi:DNA helicase-2/ATP-dependent DNA helicase PcrA
LERSAELASELRDADDSKYNAEFSLFAQAERVVQSTVGRFGGPSINSENLEELRNLGGRILQHGTQHVTAIQARSGVLSEEHEREYWQGVVRPVPKVSSPSAAAGTMFHEWASRFLIPSIDSDAPLQGDDRGLVDVEQMRKGMLRTIDEAQDASAVSRDAMSSTVNAQLCMWQRRLAASAWASRTVLWVERPIVAYLDGSVVNGKLDAIFEGGLDPNDTTKRFTIVDWKTGRRPRSAAERKEKLMQLEIYRLLLSVIEGVELDSIDACLYYLSEETAQSAEIPVLGETREAIMDIVRLGVPTASDND